MSSENYCTVEELEESFSKKIALISECMELNSMDDRAKEFYRNFETSVIELRKVFLQLKHEIKEGQDQLAEMKLILKKMESLNERLDHMQNNFPAVLKQPQVEAPKRGKLQVAAATPTIARKVKVPEKVKYLTLTEFESIPKYLKTHKMQYALINTFIDSFNKAINAKYKLLSMPRKLLKPADYKVCNAMKLQENEETKGSYFCTAEDLREYGNIKMEKSTNNFIAILRHFKRLKENRGPGPLLRYVVTP